MRSADNVVADALRGADPARTPLDAAVPAFADSSALALAPVRGGRRSHLLWLIPAGLAVALTVVLAVLVPGWTASGGPQAPDERTDLAGGTHSPVELLSPGTRPAPGGPTPSSPSQTGIPWIEPRATEPPTAVGTQPPTVPAAPEEPGEPVPSDPEPSVDAMDPPPTSNEIQAVLDEISDYLRATGQRDLRVGSGRTESGGVLLVTSSPLDAASIEAIQEIGSRGRVQVEFAVSGMSEREYLDLVVRIVTEAEEDGLAIQSAGFGVDGLTIEVHVYEGEGPLDQYDGVIREFEEALEGTPFGVALVVEPGDAPGGPIDDETDPPARFAGHWVDPELEGAYLDLPGGRAHDGCNRGSVQWEQVDVATLELRAAGFWTNAACEDTWPIRGEFRAVIDGDALALYDEAGERFATLVRSE
jgi:hypothetical protein